MSYLTSSSASSSLLDDRGCRQALGVFTPVARHRRIDPAIWVQTLTEQIEEFSSETICETTNSLALLCLRNGKIDYSIELLIAEFALVDAGICPLAADLGALLNLVRLSFRSNRHMPVDERIGLWAASYRNDIDHAATGRYAGKADSLIGATLVEEELRCGTLASTGCYGPLLELDQASTPETMRSLLCEREMLSGQYTMTRTPGPLFEEIVMPARAAVAAPSGSCQQKELFATAADGLLGRLNEIDHKWWRVLGTTVVGMSHPPVALRELYDGIIRDEADIDRCVREMIRQSPVPAKAVDPAVDVRRLCSKLWSKIIALVPSARQRTADYLATLPELARVHSLAYTSSPSPQ